MTPLTVTISGVHDLPDLTDVDAVVSIRDPDDGVPQAVQASGAQVFDLAFHDVLGEPVDRDVLPEAWHLKRLARFLDEVQPSRMHVHCFYGVSRSAAVACFILGHMHPDWTDEEVLEAVLAVRPVAQPNPLLLALADDALGRDLSGAWQDLNRY